MLCRLCCNAAYNRVVGGTTVRDLLNRLRWDGGSDAAGVEIGFLARSEGAETVESVRFAEVVEILPGGVALSGGTFIPYHRLRYIRRSAETLWRARAGRAGDES
jgi:uncharacterized protein (UPF0248 family)